MAFLYGVPLRPEDFSGRQTVALKVCERLAQQLSSTCLAGGPKTGRTSLLRYLASPQAAAKFPVLGRSINVYVSAEALGQTRTPAHFWADVLRELTRRVPAAYRAVVDKNLDRARAGALDLYDLKDLFDVFGETDMPIVLLIDDFDTLLKNQHFWPPDDYFHNVRHLGGDTPRGLAFVVATSRALNELWDPNKGASPFYNIMANVTIGELPDAELRQYLRDGFTGAGEALEVDVEDLIVAASGGHPHLANYVATLCLQRVRAGQPVEPAELEAAFGDPAGPVVTLIREIREKLSPVERQWLDMLSKTPGKLTDSQRADLAKLHRYGLLPPGVATGMTPATKFDPLRAFQAANDIARTQETEARRLLWERLTDRATSDPEFRQLLARDPEAATVQEARSLGDEAGAPVAVDTAVIREVADKARATFSTAVPEVAADRVEGLIFGTIEDLRRAFMLTLRLSQVLFYAGLSLVIASFAASLGGQDKLVTLLFGAGGLGSMLISSLVMSPLDRVQNAAGHLIQLQAAYLAYYKQLFLLGGGPGALRREDAVAYAREIDRAAQSLMSGVRMYVERTSAPAPPRTAPTGTGNGHAAAPADGTTPAKP